MKNLFSIIALFVFFNITFSFFAIANENIEIVDNQQINETFIQHEISETVSNIEIDAHAIIEKADKVNNNISFVEIKNSAIHDFNDSIKIANMDQIDGINEIITFKNNIDFHSNKIDFIHNEIAINKHIEIAGKISKIGHINIVKEIC